MSERKVTFGRIFWPSLWAALTVSVVGLIIWIVIIGAFVGSLDSSTPFKVEPNTVLHMKLSGEINEKSNQEFDPMVFKMNHTPGLADILFSLETAKSDKKIKGIFIELNGMSCGFATAKELRNAINDFEASGKFVVAYHSGEVVSQIQYYVASAADENYGFPTTNMQFLGLGTELAFFKNTMDKLGVEMQVIRGSNNDFKSAVEPFFRDNMSDSSRVQIERYLNVLWDDYLKDIATERKLDASKLDALAESAEVVDMKSAKKHKLIDDVKYRDEVIKLVADKAGIDKADDLELLAFEKYARKKFYRDQVLMKDGDPNIAVIIAEGGVARSGDGLTSEQICKLFQDARKNESVKTVVFRINSPGGSALASDEIWREVKLTNETKKVIVSMGNLAASGGYYIATPASYIFADPTTITGSIGVFGVIPNTGGMMEDKFGITFDRASTNKHSIMSLTRKLTDEEIAIIQKNVDEIYDDFKSRVAEGRKLTKAQVEVIARGRVWTGIDAKKIGLVDELGGLYDAINYAAKEAGITDKKILYYPNVKEDKFAELLEQLSDEEEESVRVKMESIEIPATVKDYYQQMKMLENYSGIQMRLPYELNIQ